MFRRFAGIVVTLLFLAAVGQYWLGEATKSTPAPTPAPPFSQACGDQFAYAASIDEMHDSVTDLDAAVRMCDTLEEWDAAAAANPGAIPAGVDPAEYLRNRCEDVTAGLGYTRLCGSLP